MRGRLAQKKADRNNEDPGEDGDRNGALEEEVVAVDESQTVAKGRPNCSLDIYTSSINL